MAILNFPDTTGQPIDGSFTFEENGVLYSWDGYKWTANTEGGDANKYVEKAGDTMTGDLTVPNLISEGDVQTTSLNGGQLAGFRNQLINGSYEINQRGITDTSDRNLYFVDRWFKGDSGGRIVAVDSTLSGFDRALSFSGAADSPIYQSIELPRTGKAGQFGIGTTWTLSCYARCSSGGDARLNKRFVNDTNQNVTDETAETFTLDTNWQHISFTFTIASAPNAANTALQVILTSLTSNELFVTGVQLEPGPVATPFEHRPIATELALCQRYYYKAPAGIWRLYQSGGSRVQGNMWFPVTMRTIPTCEVYNAQASAQVTSITANDPTPSGFLCVANPNNATLPATVEAYVSQYSGDAEL